MAPVGSARGIGGVGRAIPRAHELRRHASRTTDSRSAMGLDLAVLSDDRRRAGQQVGDGGQQARHGLGARDLDRLVALELGPCGGHGITLSPYRFAQAGRSLDFPPVMPAHDVGGSCEPCGGHGSETPACDR